MRVSSEVTHVQKNVVMLTFNAHPLSMLCASLERWRAQNNVHTAYVQPASTLSDSVFRNSARVSS